MYHIRQHIPNFIDGPEPLVADFESIEDLTDIEWVRDTCSLRQEKLHFVRSSQDNTVLLVANDDHSWWWVVGFVSRGAIDELPSIDFNID